MLSTKLAVSIATFALAVPTVFAQTTTTNPPANQPTVHQRIENQQNRIGNGVENGSLTAGEASRLERREANLHKEVKQMRSDGRLTPRERRTITRQQNQLSRNIYRQKHDAQVQPAATNEVNARQREQQQRIGQGIKSGSLTAGEAANLEHKEAGIHREVRSMRRANGGTLTPGEKAVVNNQQNHVSNQIYRKKHNGRVQK